MAHCQYRDCLHHCTIEKKCLENHSPCYNKIVPIGDLRLKVSYKWPQCYNCNSDFILINPNNFAKNVDKFRLVVVVDGIVIKTVSKVQLFSIEADNNELENEGQVPISQDKTIFERDFNVSANKIYFATIQNM